MRALLPVATGNEEIEFCALVDVLRRASIDVTVASVESLEMVVFNRSNHKMRSPYTTSSGWERVKSGRSQQREEKKDPHSILPSRF